jgi:glycosyltransferase involved in cell wall biosynthesis
MSEHEPPVPTPPAARAFHEADVPSSRTHLLSIIVPVYNERQTLPEVIARIEEAPLPPAVESEIIVIDDGSTDGTRELVHALCGSKGVRGSEAAGATEVEDASRSKAAGATEAEDASRPEAARGSEAQPGVRMRVVLHPENRGKGAAVRSGIEAASGDLLLIQDADFEYDPGDYPRLLAPLLEGHARVVYGSRFLGSYTGMSSAAEAANRFLSWLTGLLYGARITDMETCYKLFWRDVVDDLALRSNRFDIEPELTAKLMKKGERIHEVPIRYQGRSRSQGKKIGWRDGVAAAWTLVRYRFTD